MGKKEREREVDDFRSEGREEKDEKNKSCEAACVGGIERRKKRSL